jgi:hypothetical protein
MNEFCRCQTAWGSHRPHAFTEHGAIMAATVFHIVLAFSLQNSAFLPAAQVRRIIAALDEKCRDVEF